MPHKAGEAGCGSIHVSGTAAAITAAFLVWVRRSFDGTHGIFRALGRGKMNRRKLLISAGAASVGDLVPTEATSTAEVTPSSRGATPQVIGPGIWRFRFGDPEQTTPVSTRRYLPSLAGLKKLPDVKEFRRESVPGAQRWAEPSGSE